MPPPIGSAEGADSLDLQLIAFDLGSGEPFAELRDGKGASHDVGEFSPLPGDFRILFTTAKSGYARPIIWNPRTGERRNLGIDIERAVLARVDGRLGGSVGSGR